MAEPVKPRSILVTGGAGFVGSSIVRALAAAGNRVAVLDDLSTGDSANLPEEVPLVQADVSDAATASEVARLAPEVVIHAAAQVSAAASLEDPARDRAVNVEGTAHVISGAAEARVRRFIFVSSGGAVYGECSGATEQTLPRPSSYYGAHKYLAERYVELSGLSYAIARLANVYGPGQRHDLEGGVVAIFLDRLRRAEPVVVNGDGSQSRDFVHVEDVVDAVQAMLDDRRDGTWNVGTGKATTIRELLHSVEWATGRAASVDYASPRRGDVKSSCLSVESLQRDLGWRASYDLEVGLSRTVRAGGELG